MAPYQRHHRLISHQISNQKLNSQLFSSKVNSVDRSSDDSNKAFTYRKKVDLSNLPDETLYILDGTSMFFNAFYSSEGQKDYRDETFSKSLSKSLFNYVQTIRRKEPKNSEIFEGIGNNKDNLAYAAESLLPAGALITLASQFVRFIRDVKPRYLVAAFDTGNKTFRHDLYPQYKQQRPQVS